MKRESGRYGIAMAAVLLLSTTLAAPAGATTALTGVQSVTSDGASYCALLPSGHVDCWGGGRYGQLGNGKFYSVSKGKTGPTGLPGSAVPVAVKGVGGTGTLGGVASLTGEGGGYCALLISGKVDCWGTAPPVQLGNGKFYTSGNEGSAVPVAVKGVGGTGTLGGVAGLIAAYSGFCALLTSGKVDCWGEGRFGQLGNGKLLHHWQRGLRRTGGRQRGGRNGHPGRRGRPIAKYSGGYCALLTSGQVDCWGDGQYGGLGDGVRHGNEGSAVPVAVKGVGGTGTLGGVVGLTSDQAIPTHALSSPPAPSTAGVRAARASSATGSSSPVNLADDAAAMDRCTGSRQRGWRVRHPGCRGQPHQRAVWLLRSSSPPATSTAGGTATTAARQRDVLSGGSRNDRVRPSRWPSKGWAEQAPLVA